MHSVAVDELLSCESTEVVHELLFVKQEGVQPITEGTTIGYTVLVHFIQLPDHCTKETQHENTFHYYNKYKNGMQLSPCYTTTAEIPERVKLCSPILIL